MSSPMSSPISLANATQLAAQGQFEPMISVCQGLIDAAPNDTVTLTGVGNLLLNQGFLQYADQCFQQILKFDPTHLAALSGQAHIAQSKAQHHKARLLYEQLETLYPNNPIIKRNALLQMEYDPEASNGARYQKALAWGDWVTGSTPPARPPLRNPKDRILHIGYVSADLCMHTVGLMVKDVITQHDPKQFKVFTYHAGQQVDWVTKHFERKTHYRHCHTLNDNNLAQIIRQDHIDILVDLSGHTAGSRLSVFALRPAPIQVSWLGYFATTGLKTVDAVFLDEASTTDTTQDYFCEEIIKLPSRLCYSPPPFTPELANAPCIRNGYITFGSFNNTAKLNPDVIALWSEIILSVPKSKLILKWRTFNDKYFNASMFQQFAKHGVSSDRLELRGPSFHSDLLKEYADIDIALDPFPFTGGQTTCDALLMGVPVITMPQERPVSRQSSSVLKACGLTALIAQNTATYKDIARKLSADLIYLANQRDRLRQLLLNSRICDEGGFQNELARTYNALIHRT
jgi:protein O-GlcNAc transferase